MQSTYTNKKFSNIRLFRFKHEDEQLKALWNKIEELKGDYIKHTMSLIKSYKDSPEAKVKKTIIKRNGKSFKWRPIYKTPSYNSCCKSTDITLCTTHVRDSFDTVEVGTARPKSKQKEKRKDDTKAKGPNSKEIKSKTQNNSEDSSDCEPIQNSRAKAKNNNKIVAAKPDTNTSSSHPPITAIKRRVVKRKVKAAPELTTDRGSGRRRSLSLRWDLLVLTSCLGTLTES